MAENKFKGDDAVTEDVTGRKISDSGNAQKSVGSGYALDDSAVQREARNGGGGDGGQLDNSYRAPRKVKHDRLV